MHWVADPERTCIVDVFVFLQHPFSSSVVVANRCKYGWTKLEYDVYSMLEWYLVVETLLSRLREKSS